MAEQTLLITGATGLVGSNLCVLARKKGYRVRAMVRSSQDFVPLQRADVETVIGDITDLDSVLRAAQGTDGIIHTAAVLGGTWSKATSEDFWNANYYGTVNVMEAGRQAGVRRVVDLDTLAILDWRETITERSCIAAIQDGDSGYVAAKRASYYEGMHRASRGQDIVFLTPAGIYGPGLFVERALHPTSFTGTLTAALNGRLESYINLRLLWAYSEDVAATALAAFERGSRGARYLACGRPEDACTLAQLCNVAAELAGVSHRVIDLDIASGGKQAGTMAKLAERKYADPIMNSTVTKTELGVAPIAVREGLARTVAWLRQNGKI